MNEDEIRVPVYVITGFLESGKTSFIQNTVKQDYFRIEEPTLLINCEEGEVEYDTKELLKFATLYTEVDGQENMNPETLKELDRKFRPDRVLIEYNPLWSVKALEEMQMPEGWGIVQEIVVVDGSTFDIYINNMKSIFMEMAANADTVLFNRCRQEQPLASYRRSIKVANPACMVVFEDENGQSLDFFGNDLPYDLDADVIDVDDIDFGIFYVDLRDNPDSYKNKTVRFKGQVLKSRNRLANYFVPGRMAMTCCADDTQFIGYVCESKFARKLKMGSWVEITANVDWKFMDAYGEEGPVFIAKEIKSTDAPAQELVYFN